MRLAFYTYSYTDRLAMPLEPALEKIAATGYDGIDISGTHGPSADPRSVTPELRSQTRSTAERLGLTIEAVITHANLANSLFTDEPLDLKGSVDLAVDVGAPLVVFHMGGPKDDDAQRAEAWRRVVAYLQDALAYAEPRNVQLAVDGVWAGWLTDTPERFLELHDEVGSASFGINFDPCYLTLLGLDPVAVAHQWQGRIVARPPQGPHRHPSRLGPQNPRSWKPRLSAHRAGASGYRFCCSHGDRDVCHHGFRRILRGRLRGVGTGAEQGPPSSAAAMSTSHLSSTLPALTIPHGSATEF